jgi:maltose alpha-D-glucosyltransferase/alpha-amylase
MTQKGIPTIYYGDEIGMRFVDGVRPTEGSTMVGVSAPNAGATDAERAGTRTPMQWDTSANSGFSRAHSEELYIPIDPDPDRPTVEAQEADPDSLLHFIRRLSRVRRENPALGSEGDIVFLNPPEQHYPMLYERSLEGARYVVVVNPSKKATSLSVPHTATGWDLLVGSDCQFLSKEKSLFVEVAPFGYGIAKAK